MTLRLERADLVLENVPSVFSAFPWNISGTTRVNLLPMRYLCRDNQTQYL